LRDHARIHLGHGGPEANRNVVGGDGGVRHGGLDPQARARAIGGEVHLGDVGAGEARIGKLGLEEAIDLLTNELLQSLISHGYTSSIGAREEPRAR